MLYFEIQIFIHYKLLCNFCLQHLKRFFSIEMTRNSKKLTNISITDHAYYIGHVL